ncbi:molybdopterin oxidoreductase family protein [Pseudonocardia sp. K10HN5]|uniref:Molybdopterin oxidoreductase family protein n=2 Tax=Pseudonocardia acidicola TaxID=2724939 RepID=A0ABX1S2I8_9PSEU|nr:molybdopterin oxidoreductase family protein [Pseudonocardia acidicola]NMH95769.1 molybdopterin oxidoreductase family protein [Pseudonocardia acidicola]
MVAAVSVDAPRVVRAACPHDCPDTCAMLVTVGPDGRAVEVRGNPDQPVTAGFLCGKVSDYLERVYAADRLLHPLLRTGPKGSGQFRRASWDEALDAVAAGLRSAIDRHGGESVLPYSYLGTMGLLQNNSMSGRVMNALGATELVRTICADAGIAGTTITQGASPEVDPERWPNARYVLCWGWNPLSTAPHLWRLVLAARRGGAKLVVIDPFRSRTARLADEHIAPVPGTDGALALGMMRALLDADLVDQAWCRAHTTGFDELLERLRSRSVADHVAPCGVDEATVRRVAAEFARSQPSLLRLGVGAQRHQGAPMAYRTISCLPALAGSWRHDGGGFSYLPVATARLISRTALARPDLRTRPARRINMSRLGDVLTDPVLDPPVAALVCWNANPAQAAPDQSRVLAGLRREDLFTVVAEQFLTDTARHADVVLPATSQLEHLDAVGSWGHHYLTWNEPAIAPVGEAKPNTEIFRLVAARLGLDDPCFAETDEQMMASLFAGAPGGITLDALRHRGFVKIDLGQGSLPHALGRFGTRDGRLALSAPELIERGVDPLPHFDPPVEVLDADLAARFPLALLTPKLHLFLNSTFANQRHQRRAHPAPFVVLHPADAAERGLDDGERVRVFNDRGAFVAALRVCDDTRAGVAVAPTGWWCRDHEDGPGAQATTSQRLTALGAAPVFNDNRVQVERA